MAFLRPGRWGKSIAIRIPWGVVEDWGLKPGQEVEALYAANELILRPLNPAPSLEKILGSVHRQEWPAQGEYVKVGDRSYFVLSKGLYNRVEQAAVVLPVERVQPSSPWSTYTCPFTWLSGTMRIDQPRQIPLKPGEFEIWPAKYGPTGMDILRRFLTLF